MALDHMLVYRKVDSIEKMVKMHSSAEKVDALQQELVFVQGEPPV